MHKPQFKKKRQQVFINFALVSFNLLPLFILASGAVFVAVANPVGGNAATALAAPLVGFALDVECTGARLNAVALGHVAFLGPAGRHEAPRTGHLLLLVRQGHLPAEVVAIEGRFLRVAQQTQQRLVQIPLLAFQAAHTHARVTSIPIDFF
jgi:hypothetical protein